MEVCIYRRVGHKRESILNLSGPSLVYLERFPDVSLIAHVEKVGSMLGITDPKMTQGMHTPRHRWTTLSSHALIIRQVVSSR